MKECGNCYNWDGMICMNIKANNFGSWEIIPDCKDWEGDNDEC